MMRYWLVFAALVAGVGDARAADPRELYEQAVQAKGGRERLHSVRSLAIYMKPAEVNLPGPPATWLCVFPDRYFEFDEAGRGQARAVVVNRSADWVATDASGQARAARRLTEWERDQLTLNQVVFLLESAWLSPRLVEVKKKLLTVEAAGHTFQISLNGADLPERVVMLSGPGEKDKKEYDYHLQRYRAVQGIMLPARVASTSGMREWTWDVDYEVNDRFNPKFFERMPDLGKGPEPWR